MAEAAEIGTRKVIAEHSTIGIVVTTDGSITEIPRAAYVEAEERVINELKELGKPFLILLNSAHPDADDTQTLRGELAEKYDVTCMAVNGLALSQRAVTEIIRPLRVPPGGAADLPARLGGRPARGSPHQDGRLRRHPQFHGKSPPHPGRGSRGGGHGPVFPADLGCGHRHAAGQRPVFRPAGAPPESLL